MVTAVEIPCADSVVLRLKITLTFLPSTPICKMFPGLPYTDDWLLLLLQVRGSCICVRSIS